MTTPVQTTTRTWVSDPAHSQVEFSAKHMMITTVRGRFDKFNGVAHINEANPTQSHVEGTIEVNSLSTNQAQRDGHLRSADFFDAEKFPALTFKSTRVSRTGGGDLAVTGDLTIHGVTRAVVFHVEGPAEAAKDPWGNTRIGLSATTKINRKDFGLTWNTALETGGILVGDEVALTLDVQFIKA